MNIPDKLEPNIQPLDLFKILDETGSIYRALMITGKRSNIIAQQMKQEIVSRLTDFSSYSDSVEEIVENREQIEVSKIYEQMPKPTIIALYEYQNNLIEWKE